MAPDMMKKDRFLVVLRESLRWRVELKKPRTFEDAVGVAKNKEWKLRRLNQLGMDPSYKRSKVKNMAHRHMHDHHAHMVPIAPQVMLAIVTTLVPNNGLTEKMR